MKDKYKILEEIGALNAECARLREEFRACAVRLADAVTLARNESGKIGELFGEKISAYMEADARYTKAVNEATAACERLTKSIYCIR